MITWLASYPRSGNTLTRIIIHNVFGLPVPSIYPGTQSVNCGALLPPATKHRPKDLSVEEFIVYARDHKERMVLKTHDFPPDTDEPAIVVIRDARAVMASYERYMATYNNVAMPLEQLVIGAAPVNNWSDWIRAWQRRSGPTLFLRYQDMIRPIAEPLAKLETFLGVPVSGSFDITFEQMKKVNPTFFGVGSNGPGIDLVEKRCPNLFWSIHGDMMRELGYGTEHNIPFNRALVRRGFSEAGRVLHRFVHKSQMLQNAAVEQKKHDDLIANVGTQT